MGTAGRLLCMSAASTTDAGAGFVRLGASTHVRPLLQCRVCSTVPSRCHWQDAVPRLQLHCSTPTNGAMPWKGEASGNQPGGNPTSSLDRARNKLESLFVSDSSIPREEGVTPTGLPSKALSIGNKPRCSVCEAKGAIQCATCTGSGLYVDSILESQGIIVKVRCLGCGGSGDILCPTCGGRGHI